MFSFRGRACPKILLRYYLLDVCNSKCPLVTSSVLLKDFYKVLGLSKDASQKEIKTAFHDLAKKHDPDVSIDSTKREEFQDILEAYKVLSDEKLKKVYDAVGYTPNEHQHEEEFIKKHDDSMASNLSKDDFVRLMYVMFILSFAILFIPKLALCILYYLYY